MGKGITCEDCLRKQLKALLVTLDDTNRSLSSKTSELDKIEADIKAHPDRIRAFDGALHDRLAALVGDVDIDLDAPLSLEDE